MESLAAAPEHPRQSPAAAAEPELPPRAAALRVLAAAPEREPGPAHRPFHASRNRLRLRLFQLR